MLFSDMYDSKLNALLMLEKTFGDIILDYGLKTILFQIFRKLINNKHNCYWKLRFILLNVKSKSTKI